MKFCRFAAIWSFPLVRVGTAAGGWYVICSSPFRPFLPVSATSHASPRTLSPRTALGEVFMRRHCFMFGYLIDMDGVIYRGHELIPGADRFIHELRDEGVPFLFLTNNSQRTRRDVATRLQRLGLAVEEEHVFTCAMATARFLAQQKPNGTAYVIGEGGLLTALHNNGYAVVDRDPDYVVVGEGRTLNFEMAEAALSMLLSGAKL